MKRRFIRGAAVGGVIGFVFYWWLQSVVLYRAGYSPTPIEIWIGALRSTVIFAVAGGLLASIFGALLSWLNRFLDKYPDEVSRSKPTSALEMELEFAALQRNFQQELISTHQYGSEVRKLVSFPSDGLSNTVIQIKQTFIEDLRKRSARS